MAAAPLQQGYQHISRTRELDLLFILDTTSSQEPYIRESITSCVEACFALNGSGRLRRDGLRLGLVAFRDHGKDEEYVTKTFGGFTSDVNVIVNNLKSLTARGGEDGPEAVAAAMNAALEFDWRPRSVKVAVLIADAPPHGIGDGPDLFPTGDPDGHDPIRLARAMKRSGISLLVVACEPTLSNCYELAHDFYNALSRITGGFLIPLTNTAILASVIAGFTLECAGLSSIVNQYQGYVEQLVKNGFTKQQVVAHLHEHLKGKNCIVDSLITTQVYREPPEAPEGVKTWMDAKDLADGRRLMLGVKGIGRVPDAFNLNNCDPIPLAYVDITLRNTRDEYIKYSYTENGKIKGGHLHPGEISELPIKFILHRPYPFNLQCGRRKHATFRVFTKEEDFFLSQYFE